MKSAKSRAEGFVTLEGPTAIAIADLAGRLDK
jgi:hypothetical protein